MKKVALLFLLSVTVACVVLGRKYIKQSGFFGPLPDAEYLSADEAAERPVYEQLTSKEKAVYTALYRGICEKKTEIPMPFELSGEDYSRIYCILEKQEGGLFYIDSTHYTAQKIRTATVKYREESVDKILEKERAFKAEIEHILAEISGGSDFDKALGIHDYIVESCDYTTYKSSDYESTAYGCLVKKSANCEGYAKAFAYLADSAGLEAAVVTGVSDKGENHAWNQVKIDGEWYNLDATWDDLDDRGGIRHTYLLQSDENFAKTHKPDNLAGDYFGCRSTSANYFVKRDLYIDGMEAADRILRREIGLGNNAIELRLADREIYDEFLTEYFGNERVFDVISELRTMMPNERVTVNVMENEKENCLVLEIK